MALDRRTIVEQRLRDIEDQLATLERRRDNIIEERRDLEIILRRMDDEVQGA